ncbi:MAG TPA: hypothetical protein PK916_04250 [Bacteroidota bacterium]|nr:hypothetical protein [Bacteroidota bacterium]
MRRTTPILLTGMLLLLLSVTSFGQVRDSKYHFIYPLLDSLEIEAGRPVELPLFLVNMGTQTINLTVTLTGDAEFTLDPSKSQFQLSEGGMDVAMIQFLSLQTGLKTARVFVTDGALTDTLDLRVTVLSGPGPFVLLPPFQDLRTVVGSTLSISVGVQNLTSTAMNLTATLTADPGFTMTGNGTVNVPASGRSTIDLNFNAVAEGMYQAWLQVSDGSYADSTAIFVYVYDQQYKYVFPIPEIQAIAGMQTPIPVYLQNLTASTVSLNLSVSGNGFSLNPMHSNVSLASGQSMDVDLSFLSSVVGKHTGLLLVNDGTETDSLEIVVDNIPGPGNFEVIGMPDMVKVTKGENFVGSFAIGSYSGLTQQLSVSISADPEFTFRVPPTLSLDPFAFEAYDFAFMSMKTGVYYADVTVTDGVETDVLRITVYVDSMGTGGPDFTISGLDGPGIMFFEAPMNASLTRPVYITNISTAQLDVTVHPDLDQFGVDKRGLTIPVGGTDSLMVTFTNVNGVGSGQIRLETAQQGEFIYLMGYAPPFDELGGVRITNMLDFGMLDTNTTLCLPVEIENASNETITINSAVLSGFSQSFTVSHFIAPIVLRPRERATIDVCYRPSAINMVENEVLTLTLDHPGMNPREQRAIVNLSGRSEWGVKDIDSSIIGWYMNTIAAPLDGQVDAVMTLYNVTDQPITIERAEWADGNDQGIYTLLTDLPFTIQPYSSNTPNRGSKEITIRYAPKTSTSSIGVPDMATLLLRGTPMPSHDYFLTLIGIPVTPASPSSGIALFPKDNRVPIVDLGQATGNTDKTLTFFNNLDVPVTIASVSLASTERFDFANPSEANTPHTLQPGETMAVTLRTQSVLMQRTTDQLLMHGSHSHLNSRYDLISGSPLTSVDSPADAPNSFALSVSPNPSSGPLTLNFPTELRNGYLAIHDALGRKVFEQRDVRSGMRWNGIGLDGRTLIPGIYYLTVSGVSTEGRAVSAMQKLMIVK